MTAGQTLQRFVDAGRRGGRPRYEWRQIDPADGADGGQPGGNIRVAFLFDPSRVSFTDRPGRRDHADVGGRPALVGVAGADQPGERGVGGQPQVVRLTLAE